MLPTVHIFADESEFGISELPDGKGPKVKYLYSVGVAVIEGTPIVEKLRAELKTLRQRTAYSPAFENHSERARLLKKGWHLVDDSISAAEPLWAFMGQNSGIKYHVRFLEMQGKIEGKKLGRVYSVLHASLIRDLLKRYRRFPEISFNFETFQSLDARFEKIVQFCAAPEPELRSRKQTVNVLNKGENDLLSLADYMLLGTSRLMGENAARCLQDKTCHGTCRETLFHKGAIRNGHLGPESKYYRTFGLFRQSISSIQAVTLQPGVLA